MLTVKQQIALLITMLMFTSTYAQDTPPAAFPSGIKVNRKYRKSKAGNPVF